MFLSPPDTPVRLLSVLELCWGQTDTAVAGRPFHALSFRVKGNAVLSGEHRRLNLEDGAVLYMPAGMPYHLKSGEEHILVVHFEMPEAAAHPFCCYAPSHPAALGTEFRRLLEVWNGKRPGWYFHAMALWYRIVGQITAEADSPVPPVSAAMTEALDLLHRRFTDPELSVDTLCRVAGLSDTRFRQLFRQLFGTTPHAYLRARRLEYAAELLGSQLYSIERVATLSGFSDAKYFSTVFRQAYGITPSAYRHGE